MIHVPDVRRTVDWYRDIGFGVTATYDDIMTEEARVAFEFGNGRVVSLTFEQPGKAMRYVRAD